MSDVHFMGGLGADVAARSVGLFGHISEKVKLDTDCVGKRNKSRHSDRMEEINGRVELSESKIWDT